MNTYFKSIAMCFSGGGYRASCFSFGAMSLFEKVGILNNVEGISTVSGGTVTGVKYAESQTKKQDFDQFFKDYYQFLKEDKLAESAISHISGNAIWKKEENKHKRRNPINAFAIEYNKFTSQTTLGHVQDAISNNETHLKRVVFNATDFSNGLQFRFQNIKGNRLRFGNSKAHSKYKDLIDQIKLGDILASSSAFPGGFEPIAFPNDYVAGQKKEDEIALMDGGILDNQGASVFIKNDPTKNPHDLIFICDVASPYMEPFAFADKNKITRYLTYLSSVWALLIALFMAIFFFKSGWWILYTISVLIVAVMLVIQFIFLTASKQLKKATGIKTGLFIPPRRFGLFILDRMNSLLKMATEVFLKNDRRQNSAKIYDDYGEITTTATIYELRCHEDGRPENQREWDKIKLHTGEISDKIKKVAVDSAAFGTTLWFSENDKKNNILDALIACGEFTALYNLIAHMVRYKADDIAVRGSDAAKLFDDLKSLWDNLNNDPYYIINQRKNEA